MESDRTPSRILSEREADQLRAALHDVSGLLSRVSNALSLVRDGNDEWYERGKATVVDLNQRLVAMRKFMMSPELRRPRGDAESGSDND